MNSAISSMAVLVLRGRDAALIRDFAARRNQMPAHSVYPELKSGVQMATTELPPSKEKAHEIARKIANERPLKKDKDAPESNVTGGFNQKSRGGEDERQRKDDNSATEGDGQ
jgi:hypothetical protein